MSVLWTPEALTTPTFLFRPHSARHNLTGSVCELAVFPDILTPERIEAHWNARTVV